MFFNYIYTEWYLIKLEILFNSNYRVEKHKKRNNKQNKTVTQVHCEAVNICQCHETWNFHCHGDTQMLDHLQKCSLTVQGSPWPHSHPCPPDIRRFYSCGMFVTTCLNYWPAPVVMIRHRATPHTPLDKTAQRIMCFITLFPVSWPSFLSSLWLPFFISVLSLP